MKTVPITWRESLDEKDVREAMEEAFVDAYDKHEQCSGLVTTAVDSLAFPFPAKVRSV